MAIRTNRKIQEMEYAGKADSTVASEYKKLETEHMRALLDKDKKGDAIMVAKDKLDECQTIADNISMFHPIKKHRANQQVKIAKREVRRAEMEYKVAKQTLKDSQRKLREMRKEVREQYRAMRENERLNKRVQRLMKEKVQGLKQSRLFQHMSQSGLYSVQLYHIDPDPARNTRMTAPDALLFSEANKLYKAHVKAKWQNRAKKMAHGLDTVTKTIYRHASKTLGDLRNGMGKNVPEMEM